MIYVSGCPEEVIIFFFRATLNEYVVLTLIIFIGDINAFYKGLYQSNQYIRCSVLSILSEGKQPLLDFLNITNCVHLAAFAALQFLHQHLRFGKIISQCSYILLNKALQTVIGISRIFYLMSNRRFKMPFFLFGVG